MLSEQPDFSRTRVTGSWRSACSRSDGWRSDWKINMHAAKQSKHIQLYNRLVIVYILHLALYRAAIYGGWQERSKMCAVDPIALGVVVGCCNLAEMLGRGWRLAGEAARAVSPAVRLARAYAGCPQAEAVQSAFCLERLAEVQWRASWKKSPPSSTLPCCWTRLWRLSMPLACHRELWLWIVPEP